MYMYMYLPAISFLSVFFPHHIHTHINSFTVYVEAVVSGMFGAGKAGLINPTDPSRSLTVSQAVIAVFDDDVYELLMDLTVLIEQAKVITVFAKVYSVHVTT